METVSWWMARLRQAAPHLFRSLSVLGSQARGPPSSCLTSPRCAALPPQISVSALQDPSKLLHFNNSSLFLFLIPKCVSCFPAVATSVLESAYIGL